MKKKIIILLIVLIVSTLTISLAACNNNSENVLFNENNMRTTYKLNQDLELNDAAFTVVKKGKTIIEPLRLDQISGYDKTVYGKQTLTITRGDKIFNLDVNVVDKLEVKVELKLNDAKLDYALGENLDFADAKYYIEYDNGSSAYKEVSDKDIKGYEAEDIGKQVLKVVYNKEFTFDVEVNVYKYIDIYSTAGTLPTLYSALNILGSTNDTYFIYEREGTLNNNAMPEHVKLCKNLPRKEDNTFDYDVPLVEEIYAIVKNLADSNSHIRFNLYCDDIRVQRALQYFVANGITSDRYNVTLLSDGTGSYSTLFKNVYYNEGAYTKYLEDAIKFNEEYQAVIDGTSTMSWYINANNLQYSCIYYSQRDNVEYWLQYPELLVSLDVKMQEKVDSANLIKKEPNAMFADLSEDSKNKFFEMVNLDKKAFDEMFNKSSKPDLIISGTSPNGSGDFISLMTKVIEKYGDEYDLFFKPHPAYLPESGGIIDKDFLESNNIVIMPGSLPMEALLWCYPNVAIGGYNSSLYMSANEYQVKFFLNISDGTKLTTPLNDLYAQGFYSECVFITA